MKFWGFARFPATHRLPPASPLLAACGCEQIFDFNRKTAFSAKTFATFPTNENSTEKSQTAIFPKRNALPPEKPPA